MKKLVITSMIALLVATCSIARAQPYPDEYLGLPGDNLNLYAVMKLFRESETLEGFERSLNDENSRINNLDLNGDNLVDYLMVIDYVDENVHTIVLRASLDRDETQDVAVFTVQRFSDGSVQIQLVGDEALYGRNYIIEPIYAENGETPNPGYTGNAGSNRNISVVRTTTYAVASWPVVRYIYLPTYVTWRSSWHWGYYPYYWNPWRPFFWHTYYGYHYNWHHHYYSHYRAFHHHRYNRYNDFYYGRIRSYSPKVKRRIKQGNYRSTYSRPDLRRKGEVLYARTNSRQNARPHNTSISRKRTSGSSSVQKSSKSIRFGVERRSAATVTRRSATRSAVKRGTGGSRKSATVADSRKVTRPSTRPKTSTARRSPAANVSRKATTTRSGRSVKSPVVRKGTSPSRKSAAVTNNRSVKRPSARPKTSTARRSPANVSRASVPKTKSASKVGSSRSSSRQSRSAVSKRSSGSGSRSASAKSRNAKNSSTRSRGRR
jgi:hypothetical protein